MIRVWQDENGLWHADNVPLVETGIEYPAETGPITFTQEMVADAYIAITQDPAIHEPRIKLGHGSEYNKMLVGDAEQAFGRVTNVRLSDDGQTIMGDYVCPEWLAKILPYAYPSRSIEGNHDVITATGKEYKFVITSVALLGIRWPGCEVVEDLPLWFGSDIPDDVEIDPAVAAKIEDGSVTSMKLGTRAAIDTSQIRRKFYAAAMGGELDTEGDTYWWWIRGEKYDNKEGMYLIVDDEEAGELYKVPVSVKKNVVTFGKPVEVVEEYEERAAASRAAVVAGIASAERARGLEFAVHASRAETQPEDPSTQEGASSMDDATRKTMAVRLGLAEDASEDDINDEIDRLKNQTSGQQGAADTAPAADSYGTTGPSPEKGDAGGAQTQSGPAVLSPDTGEAKPEGDQPAGESDTDAGMIRVDKDTFDRLKRGSEAALAMQEQSRATEIAALLDGAVQAGKIAPARREHWAAALKADFDGNKAVLSSLADGLVPVGERGTAGNTEEGGGAGAQAEGLPSAWFPEIAAARNRQSSPVINAREG